MQLCFTENNYCRVTEDFNKAQEQLIIMTKREADLQECLTNMVWLLFLNLLFNIIYYFNL